MNAKEIYDILRAGGLSRAGALGMLGNMMAESSLISNIAQRGMTNLSDLDYTWAADNGEIDFANDAVGYGLCQWTYHTRKAALLEYSKEMNTSVGDGVMQTYFCLHELREDFPAVYHTLCTSKSIDECADLVCARYECPAVNNYSERRNNAHQASKQIPDDMKSGYTSPTKDPVKATFPPDPSIMILQMVMQYNGYWDRPDGYKSKAFFDKLDEFVKDIKSC